MLLERESPLASLLEYASDARRGEGRLVLISGEAGVGKSAIVEELERSLPDARWLWAACDGLFTPAPLAPLTDLAAQLGGELLELSRAGASRERLFAAVLFQISQEQLTVVVVEDVHWADEASVDLIRFLGKRLRNTPVLLLATYRDEALSARDPLRLALGDLASGRSTRRVGLGPLSRSAVADLARGTDLDPVELFALTGGNPFYVSEVIGAGVQTVPPSAREAVLARAGRLSHPARDLLDIAALVGAHPDADVLATVSPYASETMDELLESGLLREDGRSLQFRHEIARLAIAQTVPVHRGAEIHSGIYEALLARGLDDDPRLAFHSEAAGDGEATLIHAGAAARAAAAAASHREAVVQYERALRWSDGSALTLRAALYEGYSREVALLDRWLDAVAAAETSLALWRQAGDLLREGDIQRWLSRAYWRLCRGADAGTASRDAVVVLESLGPTRELGWAWANLANQFLLERDCEASIELAERALALATELELPALTSDVLDTLALARAELDQDWETGLDRALEIAVEHDLHAEAGRAFTNLYATHSLQRRFQDAARYFAKGLAYCEEGDMAVYSTCLNGELTSTLEKTGQWDEAAALSARLLDLGASPINRINPLVSAGVLRARRTEPGASDLLNEAVTSAEGTGEPEWITVARLARCEALWLENRSDEARTDAERLAEISKRCDSWERGAIAVWLHRTGSSGEVDGPVAEPFRLMLLGDCVAAADWWREHGCDYEAALALGDATDERSQRAALVLLEGLGATATLALLRHRMRSAGVRAIPTGPRETTKSNPAGLTSREQQVLDLVCDGYTNSQMATELFISAKTVDHHVSAILSKLGVPNRAAAKAEASRLGLVSVRL